MNKIPVIAIISNFAPQGRRDSYILSDYVYWITSAGGYPVVMNPWIKSKEIESILNSSNGLIIQGINDKVNLKGKYEKFVKKVLSKVKQLNDQGKHYPVLGIDLGLELITLLEVGSENILTKFESKRTMTKLFLKGNPLKKKFKLFSFFQRKEYKGFMRKKSNFLSINHGIATSWFKDHPVLKNSFVLTSFGKDKSRKQFATSIESRKYPIYAVAFHPEIFGYNKIPSYQISYNSYSFAVSHAILSFFIEEARKSQYQANTALLTFIQNGINIKGRIPEGIVDGRACYMFKNGRHGKKNKKPKKEESD